MTKREAGDLKRNSCTVPAAVILLNDPEKYHCPDNIGVGRFRKFGKSEDLPAVNNFSAFGKKSRKSAAYHNCFLLP